jgi:hypothetical protein
VLTNAPHGDIEHRLFRVVHPHHPLFQQEFEAVSYRQNWGVAEYLKEQRKADKERSKATRKERDDYGDYCRRGLPPRDR